MITYTYEQINEIDISEYTLNEVTDKIINNLNQNYAFTVMRDKKKQDRIKKHYKTEQFKPMITTKRVATKGIDREIREITDIMNKLTDSKYERLSQEMIKLLDIVFNDYTDENEIMKLRGNMNNIIMSNTAYLNVYANLYKLLKERYNNFCETSVNELMDYFNHSLEDIKHVNSEEDYDGFCKENAKNMKRRSVITFLIHLINIQFLNNDKFNEYYMKLLNKIKYFINIENSTSLVEELSENIFVIMKNINEETKNKYLSFINQNMEEMIKLNPRELKSYSMRTKFKYMDILDIINGKAKK